jgi:hypothetical protein
MTVKSFSAEKRGNADHGWQAAHSSLSSGSCFDPGNLNFAALRVPDEILTVEAPKEF